MSELPLNPSDRPAEPVQLLTTREVAARLRVSPESVRRLHRRGELQALSQFRHLLFPKHLVDRLMRGDTNKEDNK